MEINTEPGKPENDSSESAHKRKWQTWKVLAYKLYLAAQKYLTLLSVGLATGTRILNALFFKTDLKFDTV